MNSLLGNFVLHVGKAYFRGVGVVAIGITACEWKEYRKGTWKDWKENFAATSVISTCWPVSLPMIAIMGGNPPDHLFAYGILFTWVCLLVLP
jgi:hypothetical protein